MSKIGIALLALAGLVLLDFLLRRMEARGWIYYRKGSGAGGLGPALEQLHGAFDSDVKAAVEYQQEEEIEETRVGEPKTPSAPAVPATPAVPVTPPTPAKPATPAVPATPPTPRQPRSGPAILLLSSFVALGLIGCSLDRTSWTTDGSYRATETAIDGTTRAVSRSASIVPSPSRNDRIRLCGETWIGLQMYFSPSDHGTVAEFEARLDGSLCDVGVHDVIGGHAIVWGPVPGDEDLTTGIRSDEWTLSGTLEVTEFARVGSPPKRVDEEKVVETMRGVFHLVASHVDGDTIRLDDGSFDLSVIARRYRFEP